VVWPGVLLHDVAAAEFGFEGVLAALSAVAGESDGVDHAVVGECGCGVSVQVSGLGEGDQHDPSGDPGMCGHVQGYPGVVVEPGDDLDVGAGPAVGVGEPVVGEVGLPGLVGLLGLVADVGGLGSLGRVRAHLPGANQDPVDCRRGQRDLVVMLEMPVEGVRAGVQAGLGELLAQFRGPRRWSWQRWRSVRFAGPVSGARTQLRPRRRSASSNG
jgi:hypothetical protein